MRDAPRPQSDRPAVRSPAAWLAAWLTVPGPVASRLAAGGAALELGCGSGLACLALAEVFPAAHITGRDPDRQAIARARTLARAAGLEDRVQFVAESEARLPRGRYDLVVAAGALEPGRQLNEVRNALQPEGVCLLLQEGSTLPAGDPLAALSTRTEAAGFSRLRRIPSDGPLLLIELRR